MSFNIEGERSPQGAPFVMLLGVPLLRRDSLPNMFLGHNDAARFAQTHA